MNVYLAKGNKKASVEAVGFIMWKGSMKSYRLHVNTDAIIDMHTRGVKVADIAEDLGIGVMSVYRTISNWRHREGV